MKALNENEKLWTNVTIEVLEDREEYTSLTPGCCFQAGSCCLQPCANCCFQL